MPDAKASCVCYSTAGQHSLLFVFMTTKVPEVVLLLCMTPNAYKAYFSVLQKEVRKAYFPLFTIKKFTRHTFDCICTNTNMISIRKKRFHVKQYALLSRGKYHCKQSVIHTSRREKYPVHCKIFVVYFFWLEGANRHFLCIIIEMNDHYHMRYVQKETVIEKRVMFTFKK